MRHLSILLISFFLTTSCIKIVEDVQSNSENISANSMTIEDIAKLISTHHKDEKSKVIYEQAKKDAVFALEQELKKKGIMDASGVIKTLAPVVKVAAGYTGIPPNITEIVLGFIGSIFLKNKGKEILSKRSQARREEKKRLADLDPDIANKIL